MIICSEKNPRISKTPLWNSSPTGTDPPPGIPLFPSPKDFKDYETRLVARKVGFFNVRKKFMDENLKVQENPSKLMAKTHGFSRVKTRFAENASKKSPS